MAETETLTAEERDSLYKARDARGGYATRKALRLLDAHAAERAALVERAEKAEARHAAAEQNVLWLREQRERAEAELKSLLLGSYPAASKAAELVSRAESERNALAATLERVRERAEGIGSVFERAALAGAPQAEPDPEVKALRATLERVRALCRFRSEGRVLIEADDLFAALAGAPAPEGESK